MMQQWLQKKHRYKLIWVYFSANSGKFARKNAKSCKINDISLDKPIKIVYNTFESARKKQEAWIYETQPYRND